MSDCINFKFNLFSKQILFKFNLNRFLIIDDLLINYFPTSQTNNFNIQDDSSHTELAYEISDFSMFANTNFFLDFDIFIIPNFEIPN